MQRLMANNDTSKNTRVQGPVRQRRDNPPLLQSMHKRA